MTNAATANAARPGAFAAFDPRDPDQIEADKATWKPTENPALIAATFMRLAYEAFPPPSGVPPFDRAALGAAADFADGSEP